MSLLEDVAKPIAYLAYQQVLSREREVGYKIELNADKNRWLGNGFPFDMSSIWKKFGLDAVGVNYLTVGSLANNISTRFDSSSPYYQAWLGGYIVKFSSSREWELDNHFKLGVADQKNWLQLYGVKNPTVEVDRRNVTDLGEVNIFGYSGRLYKGMIKSNTDVGNNYNNIRLSAIWAGGVYFYKKNDPGLVLNYKKFITVWTGAEPLFPYQVIDLEGYITILEINKNTKAILYVNGARFTDKSGKTTDTFKELDGSLLEDLKQFKIVKV